MLRKIVKIDEEKCNGCGACVPSCAEGALQIIDGKAKLVSDVYCDGLGACLGDCPQDAISIEEREAPEFDEEAAMAHVRQQEEQQPGQEEKMACGCPGTMAREIKKTSGCPGTKAMTFGTETTVGSEETAAFVESQLTHWPVQLKLVSPNAPYFQDADLLLAADCVPVAYPGFHRDFLKNRPVVVGCPKLDDAGYYVEKLAAILSESNVKSLTIVHMEVPCCSGLTKIAQAAAAMLDREIPVKDVTISINGKIKDEITL